MKKFLKQKMSRLTEIGKLGIEVGSSYIGFETLGSVFSEEGRETLKSNTHLINALRIVEKLGKLKGPLMKAGQILSTFEDYLPSEFIQGLSKLQNQRDPLPFEKVLPTLIQNLKESPFVIFETFEKEAFSAASLGQVHKAVTHSGDLLAVKVQYPGMKEIMESDLDTLKGILSLVVKTISRPFFGNKLSSEEFYSEIKETIYKELDYENELKNIQHYKAFLKDEKRLVIPKPFSEFSGREVLSMEFIPGVTIKNAVLELNEEEKQAIAEYLLRLFIKQILVGKCLHADPHPGNYLYTPDHKIALLDYGCIKYFSDHFIEHYRFLLKGMVYRDRKLLTKGSLGLGIINEPEHLDYFWNHVPEYHLLDPNEGYVVTKEIVLNHVKNMSQYFYQHKVTPHPEFLFYNRALVGLTNFVSSLKVPFRSLLVMKTLLEELE